MSVNQEILLQSMDEARALSIRMAKLNEVLTTQTDQDMTPGDAAAVYVIVRDVHDTMNEARKLLYELEQRMSNTKIPDIFDINKVKTITTIEGHRVTVSTRLAASFLDKAGGFQWLRDQGQGDIITETVNAQTLSSLIKEMIEKDNIEPPPNLIKVSTSMTTSLTKAKAKRA